MTAIPTERQTNVPSIEHSELPDDAPILDVREPHEWALGRATHAVHIPLGELERRIEELPAGRPVVVTCRGGGRAGRAVVYLNSLGIDAVSLHGGMKMWCAQQRPMECDGTTPTVE